MSTPNPIEMGKALNQDGLADDIAERVKATQGNTETGLKVELHDGKRPEQIIDSIDQGALENMSVSQIEQALGLDVPDRAPETKGTATDPATDPVAAPEAKTQPQAKEAAAPEVKAPEEHGETVLARDGKTPLPYQVLADTRATVAAQSEKIGQQERVIADLQAKLASNAPIEQQREVEQHREAAASGALTDEQIQAMKGEYPDPIVDAIAALNQSNKELRGKVSAYERREADEDGRATQDIIDKDPLLSKWLSDALAGNPAMWNEAVAIDNALRAQPSFRDKTVEQRFDAVKAALGFSDQPASKGPTIEELAQQKLAAASTTQKTARALTHSDLPGGTPPAQSELQAIENMDVMGLEKVFSGPPEKIGATLAALGI